MKHIKKLLIFVLLLLGFIGIKGVLAESANSFNVDITSYFDGSEITNKVTDTEYGTSLSIEASLASQSGFAFAYYVVDDIVNEYIGLDYDFTITKDMDIKVFYTPTDKHLVLFVDDDGSLLDSEYVLNGETVSDRGVLVPSKDGMVVSSTKWDGLLTSITSNKILTLQYEVDSEVTFTYSISDDGYSLNDQVTVNAPETNNGKQFSHFEENGQIISRDRSFTITLFEDRTLTAIYTSQTVSNAPFVSISNNVIVEEGFSTFMAHFYLPDGFTLVENGMITYDEAEFNLDTNGIEKIDFGLSTDINEYSYRFDQSLYTYVRAFMIFKDANDKTIKIYSNTKACGDIVEDTLFYETGIEDDTKTSYASGTVTLSGKDWTFGDALIGTIPNDQKIDFKSVRLRDGVLETKFTIANLSKISFNQGTYGADSVTDFDLEISLDNITWYTVDSDISSDTDFNTPYEFSFTKAVYDGLGLDSTASYYIRIKHVGNDSNRINIDNIMIYSGTVNTDASPTMDSSLQSKTMTLSVTGTDEITYTVGDALTVSCTAYDMINGLTTCMSSGYNMDIPGIYTVVFSALDFEGNIHTSTLLILVEEKEQVISLDYYLTIDYVGYYDGIEGLYGQELMDALRDIIQAGVILQTYDDARQALGYIDADPEVDGNILLVYNRASVSSLWDGGTTWNREHVWPNSRLGVDRVSGSDRSIASDLQNLRSCDSGVNSARNNDIYTDSSDGTWNPGVEDQGDVARILFYMATMYPQLTLTDEATSKNVDGLGYTLEGALMGDLEDLLAWNLLDETDLFEITRNDRIEEYQNNRNPFIDYPYLAELIWNYEATN